jgi:RNA polymerase sigma-32 factor
VSEEEKFEDIPMPLDFPPSDPSAGRPDGPHAAVEVYDPLKKYLMEIRKFPLLTREEEIELAQRWKEQKDRFAAYQLVVSNLRLVVKIAFDYQRAYTNLLDLIQEGNLGLMQAVKKFDPYRNVKLSSYASWWIRAYILKFIIDNWSLVKIGTTQAQRKLFFRLKKEKGRLEAMGFDPGPKLLAGALHVTKEEVTEMDKRLAGGDLSLDAPLAEDSRQTYRDVLPIRDGLEETVAETEFREALRQKIEGFSHGLKHKERFLLENRLLAENPMTLQTAGSELRISRERARQIEKRVLDKLKNYLKDQFPDLGDFEFTLERPETELAGSPAFEEKA